MTTTSLQSFPAADRFPQNLTHWTGEAGLAGLAEAIARDTWTALAGGESVTRPSGPGDRLLAVLAGCYAAGIFAAEDILWAAAAKPLVRRLSGGRELSAAALQRFQRTHRLVLETCLGRLLFAAGQARLAGTDGDGSGLAGRERERFTDALAEARRRIQLARQFDLAFSE